MALINCPDCGKPVSSEAPYCIHCGAPILIKQIVLYEVLKKQKRKEKINKIKEKVTGSLDPFGPHYIGDLGAGCVEIIVCLIIFIVVMWIIQAFWV
jgi:hypothetical protein